MSDAYAYWQNALELTAGKRSVTREEMKVLGVHDTAEAGFFRKRTKRGGEFLPAAIWPDESGKMVALLNGFSVDAAELWSYCASHPISEDQYHSRMETGRWHDEDASVTESLAHDPRNAPADPAEALRDQIEAALKGVKDYETVTDDETASKAQSLRSRLLDLRGEADGKRESLVRPHLDAQKSINEQYMPMVKEAKAGADVIAKALGAHETAKENARKAAEAVRLKIEQEAEKARLAAIEAGKPLPPAPTPPTPAPAPAPQTRIAGAYGRAAAVKTVKVGSVIDQDAFYTAIKDTPEVKAFFAERAQKFATAGVTMPGMAITEEKRVS